MNTTARLGGLGAVFALLLTEVPEQYTFYAAMLVIACGTIAATVPPPVAGGRWAAVYHVISAIGLNIGWAESRLKPGVSGIPVSRGDEAAARQAVHDAGIPVLPGRGQAVRSPEAAREPPLGR
ncbi:hypothetical protein [Komagataeibacter saccharivorans]|uniref:hypothetical protein n=1 Tax=Komagataeibacter saccharivorans TaxID=265959 RepID=UPI001A42D476|nr:hypothetical protein [Novacetimonas hansenii]